MVLGLTFSLVPLSAVNPHPRPGVRLVKQISVCVCVWPPCPLQAVSEEQPGCRGTSGKQEESTGTAKVREEVGRRRCWSQEFEHFISLLSSLLASE